MCRSVGQDAKFIHERCGDSLTADFTGTIRFTAPVGQQKFTGVVMEMDVASGIFSTLPVVSLGTAAPVGFGLEEHERGKKEHIWNTRPS